jgi:hypothetical protein
MKNSVCNPFLVSNVPTKFQDNFDEFYVDYEIKQVVKKVGDGEEDFIIEDKVIEHKRDIKQEINAQADDVGVYNLMKRVALTGDDSLMPEPMPKTGVTSDYTNVPDNLLDADLMAKQRIAEFDSLPDALKKGRSFEEFMSSFTQDEFSAWLSSLAPVDKKEGDK